MTREEALEIVAKQENFLNKEVLVCIHKTHKYNNWLVLFTDGTYIHVDDSRDQSYSMSNWRIEGEMLQYSHSNGIWQNWREATDCNSIWVDGIHKTIELALVSKALEVEILGG